jgi:hypothetical protein
MPIELIENPPVLQTSLALHSRQGNSRAVEGYPLNDESRVTEEEARLLLSWRAVLGEFGSGQLGAGQW